MSTRNRRPGSLPRGFKPGAALAPSSTVISGLYAERVALFDRLVESFGSVPSNDDALMTAIFALDRRILAAAPARLADLGAKARILRTLYGGFSPDLDIAARVGFETLVIDFLLEIERTIGSPVDRAAGLAAN